MMEPYILILWLLSPGGDYMGKIGIPYKDSKSCEVALKKLRKPVDTDLPFAPKAASDVCVTEAHWTGKKPMKNVPLD